MNARRALLALIVLLTAVTAIAAPAGTLRAAISEDATLTEAEAEAGTAVTGAKIRVPTWDVGDRYVFIGVPADHEDISDILQTIFPVFAAFEASAEVDGYKWWRTVDAQGTPGSGVTYTVEQ